MSKYYNPKRTRNIFDPASRTPFKLSRSKIDSFLACPRCFYFDRRLGIGQPPGFPFNLNKAVDTLLKKEFDIHRAAGNPHPLMKTYKVDAIPFKNENIEKWRDALSEGIQYFHKSTNFIITGAIDDIWVNPKGELIIVDYKATSKTSEVNLDSEWQDGYKRQMEIYQWLFRKNDFKVNDTGYFVYCNGDADKEAFDGKLEFDIKLLPYKGDASWVEATILKAHKCLMSDEIPDMGSDCDFCAYRKAVGEVEK
ncbi:MAG: PD-(D/E)XK nuclease family protein [Patescibacteria group bacterium]